MLLCIFYNMQLPNESFKNAVVACSDTGGPFQFIIDAGGAMMGQIFSCEQ